MSLASRNERYIFPRLTNLTPILNSKTNFQYSKRNPRFKAENYVTMALVFDGNDQGGLENGIINGGPHRDEEQGEQAFPLKRFDNIEAKFGFDLYHLYKLAVSFYRGWSRKTKRPNIILP